MKSTYLVFLVTAFVAGFNLSVNAQQATDSILNELDSLKLQLDLKAQKEDSLLNQIEADQKALKEYRREFEVNESNKRTKERKQPRINDPKSLDEEKVIIDSDSLKEDQIASLYKSGRNRVFEGVSFGISGLTYNRLFDLSADDELKGFELNHITSINWAVYPVELDIRLINEYFKFSTGLGYNVLNFTFSNNFEMYKDDENIVRSRQLDDPDYTRNRFRTGYLSAPLLFHINTHKNPSKSFHLAFGGTAGIKIFDTYRRRYRENQQKVKINKNGGWNVNQFTFDARASIGYGTMHLYASHSLIPLFQNNTGPEVYPFTIGLSFTSSFE